MSFWQEQFDKRGLLSDGGEYELQGGIARQKGLYSQAQKQTEDAFAYKWARDTYESDVVKDATRAWELVGFFDGDEEKMKDVLFPDARMLDAGCGSGFSALALFGRKLNEVNYLGVDISTAVDVAKQRFEEEHIKGEFMQSDLLTLPFNEPTFDIVFSTGVLHHTDSTERGIKKMASLLVKNGKFLFYVYRKKAPIREWTDDYVREQIRNLSDEDAWKALESLTKLGIALGELNVQIDIPEEVRLLGIPKGKIDIQRLFYWYVIKAYYRSEFTLDEMNHINFDWFRPLNCHRQTPEEVRKWCDEVNLRIDRMHVEEAGMYVTATKL